MTIPARENRIFWTGGMELRKNGKENVPGFSSLIRERGVMVIFLMCFPAVVLRDDGKMRRLVSFRQEAGVLLRKPSARRKGDFADKNPGFVFQRQKVRQFFAD